MEVKIYIYIYILDTFLPTFFDYALSDLIFYGDDHFTRGCTYLFSFLWKTSSKGCLSMNSLSTP